MIRILHTSDWHLGHTLYNYDRSEEQYSMLRQIGEIIKRYKPDAMIISGDIYHTSQPSATIQTMFTDAIVQMHQLCPTMTIVITAGNHDSGSRHEIFRTPWQALNVYVLGTLEKDYPENHLIEIPDKGYIIAVPYANERLIPEGFYQQLLDKTAEMNVKNLPVILSAHTTVRGCDFKGHDNASEYTVGGIDYLNLESMGHGYDYLALGHIHHSQFVAGGGKKVRYSGSPLAVSFDESYPHSVSMVEIDAHNSTPRVEFERLEITNPRPLVTLPLQGFLPWEEAKALLEAYPDDIAAYIRLNVEIEDFLPPEANVEANAIAERKGCRFCLINTKRKEQNNPQAQKAFTVQEFKEEKPIDLARRFAHDMGECFDEEMEALFNEVVKSVNEENQGL